MGGKKLLRPKVAKGSAKPAPTVGPFALGPALYIGLLAAALAVALAFSHLAPGSSSASASSRRRAQTNGGSGRPSPQKTFQCGSAELKHLRPDDYPARGYHVLTLDGATNLGGGKVEATVHVDGTAAHDTTVALASTGGSKALRAMLEALAASVAAVRPPAEARYTSQWSHAEPPANWGVFTPAGARIRSVEQIAKCGIAYVFEGGNFVWPGVAVGHKTELSGIPGFGNITLITHSLRPVVITIEPLLSEAEADHVVALAKPEMAPSPVSHIDSDVGKPSTEWRTSTQARLAASYDSTVDGIEDRVARIVNVPKTHGEPLQVLRYTKGQHYHAHTDYFDPELYKEQPGMLDTVEHGRKNRLATLLWYMSDVAEGGETVFPRAHKAEAVGDFASCDVSVQGIKVPPKKGKAVLFYSLLPDGSLDEYSLHGGCDPSSSETKWAVNKWVWSKAY